MGYFPIEELAAAVPRLNRKARRRLIIIGGVVGAVFLVGLGFGALMARRGPKIPDDKLAAAARDAVAEALKASGLDSRLVVAEVRTSASDGVVALDGAISEERVRPLVTTPVAELRGVHQVVDRLLLLPDPALGERKYGVVKVGVGDLGASPGSDSGKNPVTQALLGAVVDLLQERESWYLVRMADGYLGWLEGGRLHLLDQAGVEAWRSGRRAVVAAKMAWVYEGASKGSMVLAEATMGTDLPSPDEPPRSGLARVCLPGGRVGWIDLAAVAFVPAEAEVFAARRGPEAVITTAKLFLGLPYRWGGTSAKGFDCSGLTQFAFRLNGYRLPRDADQQYGVGDPVSDRAELRPGDLVFFSIAKPGPSHVGIYVGEGRFINAAGPGVVIYSFRPADKEFNPSMAKQYIGARRVIK